MHVLQFAQTVLLYITMYFYVESFGSQSVSLVRHSDVSLVRHRCWSDTQHRVCTTTAVKNLRLQVCYSRLNSECSPDVPAFELESLHFHYYCIALLECSSGRVSNASSHIFCQKPGTARKSKTKTSSISSPGRRLLCPWLDTRTRETTSTNTHTSHCHSLLPCLAGYLCRVGREEGCLSASAMDPSAMEEEKQDLAQGPGSAPQHSAGIMAEEKLPARKVS